METQKIANLLVDTDNESSNLEQENGILSMIKITQTMLMEIKII